MTSHSTATIIGWDIGGAHVKAALITNATLQQVVQIPCPLWLGLEKLEQAIETVMHTFALSATSLKHAVTMTGELVDLFPNRAAGVQQIAATMQAKLTEPCWFYQCDASRSSFLSLTECQTHWPEVASANWHASASLLAQAAQDGLLVDIGSTTTDILAIHAGRVHHVGQTDATRLRTGELVYTGVVRTPLMALGPSVDWHGLQQPLAAEYFATTADVYRFTQQLSKDADMADAADGGEKTLAATAIRLARMVGHDVEDFALSDWQLLAEAFKAKQLTMLVHAVQQQLTRLIQLAPTMATVSMISAGVGGFLVKEIIAQLLQSRHYPHMQWMDSSEILRQNTDQFGVQVKDVAQDWTAQCLPAVAVAILGMQADLKSHQHGN